MNMRVESDRMGVTLLGVALPLAASLVAQRVLRRRCWPVGVAAGLVVGSITWRVCCLTPGDGPVDIVFAPEDSWKKLVITTLNAPASGWRSPVVWIQASKLENFLSVLGDDAKHLKRLIVVVDGADQVAAVRKLRPNCELAFEGRFTAALKKEEWYSSLVNRTAIETQVYKIRFVRVKVGERTFDVDRKVLRQQSPFFARLQLDKQDMFELKDQEAFQAVFPRNVQQRIDQLPGAFGHLYAIMKGGGLQDCKAEELEVMAGLAAVFEMNAVRDQLLTLYASKIDLTDHSAVVYFVHLVPPRKAMDRICGRVKNLTGEEAIDLAQLAAAQGTNLFQPLAEAAFDRIIAFGRSNKWSDSKWQQVHGRLAQCLPRFPICNAKWDKANLPINI